MFEQQWTQLRSWVVDGSFAGRHLQPWPSTLGGPTLMLAGWRGRWVERAAVESDGWIASGAKVSDDQLADAITRFREAGGARAIVTNVQVSADLGPAIERIHRLAAMGFDDVVVGDTIASAERLATIRQAINIDDGAGQTT